MFATKHKTHLKQILKEQILTVLFKLALVILMAIFLYVVIPIIIDLAKCEISEYKQNFSERSVKI